MQTAAPVAKRRAVVVENSLADVGVIVIGRNEAPRLGACLAALADAPGVVVYVDSGSCDGSADIAAARGVEVIRLHDGPHTAARGRQTGLDYFRAHHPELRYVQFVDGDCALDPGWLGRAAAFLDAHPDVGVVVGRLRERETEHSLWVRLVNADWDLPAGETDAIGGISMARIPALRQVDGWRTDLIAGEELDLGARLRSAGWKLYRLADDMTYHDIGIRSFGEFWRRSVRSGFAYAELAVRHGRSRCRRWLRRAISNVLYGALLPVLLIVGGVLWWPVAAAVAGVYLLLIARVVRHRRQHADGFGFAVVYALMLIVVKVAGAWGAARYVIGRISGRRTAIIEYKAAQAAAVE